jgi:hypothetical protein
MLRQLLDFDFRQTGKSNFPHIPNVLAREIWT